MKHINSLSSSDFSPSSTFNFKNTFRRDLKSPNSPLIKQPYIKVKIEGKNLEKSLLNSNYVNNEKQNINLFISNISRYFITITPYVEITLNKQKSRTKSISSNSPVWPEEFEFEVQNIKTDKIYFEIFTENLLINSTNKENEIKTIKDRIFLAFQIIPIKYLEASNKVGEKKTIWLRLINKKLEEFFIEDKFNVLHIDNHNPDNYKIEETLINKEKDIGVPLIKLTLEYVNLFYLWFLKCNVQSIIQREDSSKKSVYWYKLYVRRNDGLDWYKEATYDDMRKLRNSICKFVKEIQNIPFPMNSIFEYFPFIGSFYSDENNDVLIEKKIILDNFFEQVCLNLEVYKLEVFINFFKEN